MKTEPQHVGIEVEFAGIDFDEASAILARDLKATPSVVSPHEHEFETDGGTYRLEVDFELLKRLSRDQHEDNSADVLQEAVVGALDLVASIATPLELVSPPIPVDEIEPFCGLLDALAKAGACGTRESLLYAFGVHFNPSADLDTAAVLAHIQAFLGLHDWLQDRDATDLSRILSAFAAPFPEEYERLVLARDYDPDMDGLIDDYLAHNPTRNRALDMLPLFAEVDEARVRAALDDERVNARPTYHYRLPNSRLGDADWSLLKPWRDWLEVERLAADPGRLGELCDGRLAHLDKNLLTRRDGDWIASCQALIDAA